MTRQRVHKELHRPATPERPAELLDQSWSRPLQRASQSLAILDPHKILLKDLAVKAVQLTLLFQEPTPPTMVPSASQQSARDPPHLRRILTLTDLWTISFKLRGSM